MMGLNWTALSLLVAGALASGGRFSPAAPTPKAENPAPQKARFTYWPLKRGRIVAADQRALWFDADGALWRYDVPSRSLDTFDILDGLPATSPDAVVLGPEGSFAMGYTWGGRWSRCFVWRAGKGWTLLERIGRGGLCFDADGSILCSDNNPAPREGNAGGEVGMADLKRLEGDRWISIGRVPQHARLYALARGWLFYDYVPVRNQAQYRFGYVQPDLSKWTLFDNPQSFWLESNRHYLADGKVYVVCRPPDSERKRYLAQLAEDGLRVVGEVSGSGLDLRRGPIHVLLKRRDAQQSVYAIASADGVTLGEMPVPADRHPYGLPLAFRDANGDVWLDDWRWDGKQWEQVRPGNAPTVDAAWRVLESGLFSLESQPGPDGRRLSWRKLYPDVPDNAECFDPVRRTGWIETWDKDRIRTYFQFMRWPKDGAPEVIRSFPEIFRDLSRIQVAPDGDYWWVGRKESVLGDTLVWRLTAAGELLSYSCDGADRSTGGRARPRMLCVSPAGKVWMWSVSGGFESFDPQAGEFVRAEPWEEFAFTFGKWRLSVLPVAGARNSEDFTAPIGTIMVNRGGKWLPLICPFGSGPLSVGRMRAFRGDRMLATASSAGVVEYDATRDRWCLLAPNFGGPAGFDPAGRRVMGHQSAGLLALEGDPFDLVEGVPDIRAERDLFYPLYDRIRGRDGDDAEAGMREMEQLPTDTRKLLWPILASARLELEKEKSAFYKRVLALEMSVRSPHRPERPSALRAAHPWLTPTRLPPAKEMSP